MPPRFCDIIRVSQDSCSPFLNNLICCLWMILYTKGCLEGIAIWRRKFGTYSKQLLYATLSSNVIFWSLFDTSDCWSWRLNIVVPCAMLIRFIYKGAIVKDPEDPEVRTFSSACSPAELLFGPVQFALVLIFLGLHRFVTEDAAILTAALVGDLIAPVIGAVFGRHDYHMPFSSQKTMEGSLCGVFLGTCSSIYFFLYIFGLQLLPLRVVLAYAGIAAVVEGSAPNSMDNLAVPLVLMLSIDRVRSFLDTFIGETLSLQADPVNVSEVLGTVGESSTG